MNKNIKYFRKGEQNKKLSSHSCGQSQFTWNNNVACNISREQDYLNKKNIFDIFHFLLSHVIVQQPTNPIQYLYELLDDFILFRSGLKNPRLLWTKRHVDAIFGNVLSRDSELLPLDDYKIAMKTLSVHYYDPCPVQVVPGHIDRQTFCTEALNNMKKELMRIANETI